MALQRTNFIESPTTTQLQEQFNKDMETFMDFVLKMKTDPNFRESSNYIFLLGTKNPEAEKIKLETFAYTNSSFEVYALKTYLDSLLEDVIREKDLISNFMYLITIKNILIEYLKNVDNLLEAPLRDKKSDQEEEE